MSNYIERVVDRELDDLMPGLAAIAIDGPRGVGKSETTKRRAGTFFALDDADTVTILASTPSLLDDSPRPLVLDEWQRLPELGDRVRRSVDADPLTGGRFLLTGSAAPHTVPLHSGAGRIVSLRMRPLALSERGLSTPSVSLAALLDGGATVEGETLTTIDAYVEEIVASGFPGIRMLAPRARRSRLDGYLASIAEREFGELGIVVRRPSTLRAWLAAYAAATASTASYNSILDAALAGENQRPAKTTTIAYRDALAKLWMLDPVEAWLPTPNPFTRLASAPKHFLADPALAARLLGLDERDLLRPRSATPIGPQPGPMLGRLFEALVAQSVLTYAQAAEARVGHLRTRNGDHEVDLIVHRGDHTVVAIEVTLSAAVGDADVRHLDWLHGVLGDALVDRVVINTGRRAYRRSDGVAVVPAALLGP
jgi:predicted AAA+ superfamily ATPase